MEDSALKTLENLINFSFKSGIFPKCLKTAIVISLYKGGDENDPSNFRPIALLSTMSKLIEKIVKSRFMFHLEIAYAQFGFQKKTKKPPMQCLNYYKCILV